MSKYQSTNVPFYASWKLFQIVLGVLSLIPVAIGVLAKLASMHREAA
ncbi:MAG: hypothetical protein ACRDAM_19815 [Casimicrobium sp.]